MTTRDAAYEWYKNEYLLHDGVQDATLTKTDGTTVEEVKVRRHDRAQNQAQAGMDAGIEQDTTRFTVWDVTLDGNGLDEGDTLTVGSDIWVVVGNVARARWDTQWIVDCTLAVSA